MKRILILLSVLLVGLFVNAQAPYTGLTGYAIKQSLGSDSAIVLSKGALAGRMVVYNFADTTTANTQRIKNYPGAFIFTIDSSKLWVRNNVATQWLSAGGSGTGGDIVSFNFITDSSLIICYENGACDTIPINNFTEIVTNIIQNFNDSSVYNLNDSTIIICTGSGDARVCDTISLGTTNTYYFTVTGDTLITCDTVQIICTVPDSCYQQQLCDTIILSNPPPSTVYQNGLFKQNNIVEWTNTTPGGGSANLYRNSYIYTRSPIFIEGGSVGYEVLDLKQFQWSQNSSSIMSFKHYGAYQPTFGLLDEDNPVKLYMNYTDPFVIPSQGALSGDTVGFMGDRYGYLLMTNAQGGHYRYTIDDINAKQAGLMIHTYDTNYTDAVTIFGNQTPAIYGFTLNPPTDSTLLDSRIAVFKTTGQQQNPAYTSLLSFPGTAEGLIGFDSDGNLITTTGISEGSTTTILNDSTIEVCTGGVCDTLIFSDVDAQNVFVINDSTLLVCNVDNTVCDTVNIPQGFAFFDRGFFDPDQASLGATVHNANSNDFSLINTDNFYLGTVQMDVEAITDGTHYALQVQRTSATEANNYWQADAVGGVNSTNFRVSPYGAIMGGRFQLDMGVAVAAANDFTVGGGGNLFHVTGATQINAITTTNWQNGSEIELIFDAAPLVKNNTAGGAGTAPILLAGRTDFQAAAGDYLRLQYDGINWYETNRALASGAGITGITADQGVKANTATNVRLGGDNNSEVAFSSQRFINTSTFGLVVSSANATSATTSSGLVFAGNSLTTGTGIYASSSSLSSGSLMHLVVTGTAAASSTQRGLFGEMSGANATSGQTTRMAHVTNFRTGTSSTNIALMAEAGSGSNNYGIYAIAGGANTAVGVFGETTGTIGIGVYGFSNVGSGSRGVRGFGQTGSIPLEGLRSESSTNTALDVLYVSRNTTTSAGAAAGIGAVISFQVSTDAVANTLRMSNELKSIYTTTTDGARTSSLTITGVLAGSTVDNLVLAGDGSVKLRPITAAAASAITPAEGMILFTSDTDGTFTSVGFWGYQGGAWVKM